MKRLKKVLVCIFLGTFVFLSCDDITGEDSDSKNGDKESNLTEQIIFTSNRSASNEPDTLGNFEGATIHRMNPDGSGVTQITELRSENESHFEASVSPDGTEIAFSLMIIHEESSNELYVYKADADGSNITEVAGREDDHLINPRWSPADSRIAFGSNRDGDYEIYTIESDGTDLTKITDNEYTDAYPTWSPNGNRIAFTSDRSGSGNIHIKDLETGEVVQATDINSSASFPRWSPDGSRITFTSDRDGDNDAYIYDLESSEVTKITNSEQIDNPFTWSPEGDQLGLIGRENNSYDVFKTKADGSGNIINLTNHPAADWDPHWDSLEVE